MFESSERGARSERGSALWGTGRRGGDRSSVLWGKGGRGMLVASIAAVALAAPLAATASPEKTAPSAPAKVSHKLVVKVPAKAKPAAHKAAVKTPAFKKAAVKKAAVKKPAVKKPAVKKPVVKTAPKKTAPTKTAPVGVPAAPVAAPTTPVPTAAPTNTPTGATYVAPTLVTTATTAPADLEDVIIQSSGGVAGAQAALDWLGDNATGTDLDLIGGIEAKLPASDVAKLQTVPGLTVTPNDTIQLSGSITPLKSTQIWPYETGNALMWPGDTSQYVGKTPAIAIVDSGIQQGRADFGNRLLASVDLSTLPNASTPSDPNNTSTDDENGHGTFVAGMAAGAAPDLAGADPAAPLVSIKVMNDQGEARTSDVIAACQWILDHKAQYNIRVANFSLHSSYGTNFYRDPLDQAVEKLWFNGVVVVAAAGNYGTPSGPSGVLYAPGNDPFVITVGALDLNNTLTSKDDTVAPFSAYGYTEDGFYKPEISAPGRYMVGPIVPGSTLTGEKPQNMVGTDRIQLSGTSFSAPIVAGTVANMLARHPNWTPDQVKGALMRTASVLDTPNPLSAGLGELVASRAVTSGATPNPNKALEQFVTIPAGSTTPVFNATNWAAVAKSNPAWNDMSWTDQSWSDQSWSDQAVSALASLAMSWTDMSWTDMSWTDMSWTDMSWTDVSQEDAAEGDSISGTDGYTADPSDIAAAADDSDTAVPVDGLDPVVALGVADDGSSDGSATPATGDDSSASDSSTAASGTDDSSGTTTDNSSASSSTASNSSDSGS